MIPWWVGFVALGLFPLVWTGIALYFSVEIVRHFRGNEKDGAELDKRVET
jgi:hypothetical protein